MISNKIWFETGIEHILDFSSYDHLMFLCLLAYVFPIYKWKKILILITAFTLGHALSISLNVILNLGIPSDLIEFLIMLSIALTALIQLVAFKNTPIRVKLFYFIICCFGLLHGLGFSYVLKSMMGHQEDIIMPLVLFNLGIEVGQLIFMSLFFLLIYLIQQYSPLIEKKLQKGVLLSILMVSLFFSITRLLNFIHS